jgi:hypothetical protein
MIRPRLSAGSASERSRSTGSVIGTPFEITGNQFRCTAKATSISTPETKAGKDKPASETMRATQSGVLSRWRPAQTPSGTPNNTPMIERGDGEFDGEGQHGHHVGHHRAVGDQRAAEIASEDAAHEVQILRPQGLIEPHAGAQLGQRLRRRLIAEHDESRVARHDAHQHEDERQHRQQGRQRDGEASEQVADHGDAP